MLLSLEESLGVTSQFSYRVVRYREVAAMVGVQALIFNEESQYHEVLKGISL